MSYIPKSKLVIKQAEPDALTDSFFTLSSPKVPYAGPYMETSDGRYFIGTNFTTKGEELFKTKEINPNFADGDDFDTYLNVNSLPYNFLKKVKPIPAFKNIPTEKDYERGYYDRYFVSRVNQQFGYKEIKPKIYKSIIEEQGEYDHHLYDVGSIKWAIMGNVYKINQLNILQKEKRFPYLGFLFPILNEFQRSNLQVQTNLNTEGDELYYIDGTEYIGSYHIHPSKGPMEGSTHTSSKHARLYYKNDLPTPANANLDDEFQEYLNEKAFKNKQKINRTIKKNILNKPLIEKSPTSGGRGTSTSSGRSTSTSGGGRGGY